MSGKTKNLVIVESLAKSKTISKYLGESYMVSASVGHLRDLPKSKIGVDIENGFLPDYTPVAEKAEIIKKLSTEAKKSSMVYLATDPDREGEAISWHLKELLKLPDDKVCRVTFNEINKNVILQSIKSPRAIDMSLVNAQQARRILDRIVGYQLSPLLWKKIRRGLSAGRVQSVASRIVVDREEEIRNFIPVEYWILSVKLSDDKTGGEFTATFHGDLKKKIELGTEDEVIKIINAVSDAPFRVHNIKKTEKKRSAPPPYITSTLQQDASRRLGMTPRYAMSVAQQLYEGIEIKGKGTFGLITYMRTDSFRVSSQAQNDAKKYIIDTFGEASYPNTPNFYKSKSNAQDAHEAVRPSDVFFTPDSVKASLTRDQHRLYKLIWNRFIASQMTAAKYDSILIEVVSSGYVFRASNSTLKFAGFSAVYDEKSDSEAEIKVSQLPELNENDILVKKDINKEQKFTAPPSRYSEATLIKAMEDSGVGRPSTYSPTISTILSRDYVVKEGKLLRPTALGEVVVNLMKERFSDIVDLNFTAKMEEHLDCIERGDEQWQDVLSDFYKGFKNELDSAEVALEGQRIKVPDEISEELCDVCGKNMIFKSGRFGKFLGCPGYPECTFTKPIVIEMPGRCPKCGNRILKRTSKNGKTYYACEYLKDCEFITWDIPVADNCELCGQTMFKLSGRGAKKPFCINDKCKNFLPEDKRGYYKKADADSKKTSKNSKPEAAKPATTKPVTAKRKTASKPKAKTKSKITNEVNQ